ncbi:hypothetical protein AB1Y20_021235 [Prymnesium parvum]|uniref:Uncharacterized protein n=1 Tax=Prymnesium parvum TaxID=97485 RepID=A0AB34JJJ6_PRYPA
MCWDPLTLLERALSHRPPAMACCGFWPLDKGVRWALYVLVLEAIVQLLLSLLRPASLWMLSPYVFFCFLTQDILRIFLLAASLWSLRALRMSRGVITALRGLFRALVVLSVMEVTEMFLKLGEEEAICERDMHDRGHSAVQACELINDVGEIIVTIATVLGLLYIAWVVLSFVRFLKVGSRGPQVAPSRSTWKVLPSASERPSIQQAETSLPSTSQAPTESQSSVEVEVQGCGKDSRGSAASCTSEAQLKRSGDSNLSQIHPLPRAPSEILDPPHAGICLSEKRIKQEILDKVQQRVIQCAGAGHEQHAISRSADSVCAPAPNVKMTVATEHPSMVLTSQVKSKSRRKNPARWLKKRAKEVAHALSQNDGRQALEEDSPA